MRLAAIADIHGNCFALQAVLADAADLGVQEFVNLGDHVSGPLEAAKTADLLMELGFPSVRGDQVPIPVDPASRGHTHIQRVVRLPDGRLIVNPGSVGLPGFRGRGPVPYKVEIGTPHASYAIIERKRDAWSVTLRFVPYDSRAAAEMAQHAGMSDWASALARGWVD